MARPAIGRGYNATFVAALRSSWLLNRYVFAAVTSSLLAESWAVSCCDLQPCEPVADGHVSNMMFHGTKTST